MQEILGYHTNFPLALNVKAIMKYGVGAVIPQLVVESSLAERMYPVKKILLGFMEEFGYMHELATKPDTVGKFCIFFFYDILFAA